jgi:hypothetical protein
VLGWPGMVELTLSWPGDGWRSAVCRRCRLRTNDRLQDRVCRHGGVDRRCRLGAEQLDFEPTKKASAIEMSQRPAIEPIGASAPQGHEFPARGRVAVLATVRAPADKCAVPPARTVRKAIASPVPSDASPEADGPRWLRLAPLACLPLAPGVWDRARTMLDDGAGTKPLTEVLLLYKRMAHQARSWPGSPPCCDRSRQPLMIGRDQNVVLDGDDLGVLLIQTRGGAVITPSLAIRPQPPAGRGGPDSGAKITDSRCSSSGVAFGACVASPQAASLTRPDRVGGHSEYPSSLPTIMARAALARCMAMSIAAVTGSRQVSESSIASEPMRPVRMACSSCTAET